MLIRRRITERGRERRALETAEKRVVRLVEVLPYCDCAICFIVAPASHRKLHNKGVWL